MAQDSQTTTRIPDNILIRILEYLYVDFLASGSEESTTINLNEHHCSLLHPCVSISKSATFKAFYTFRLVASDWEMIFQSTAKLDRYASYKRAQEPQASDTSIYTSMLKIVILGRYRVFHNLGKEHGFRGVFEAYDFGGTGGCKEPKKVIIKAWIHGYYKDYLAETKAYDVLSTSPMKGVPSLIETNFGRDAGLYSVVLEMLGPSLEDICGLIPDHRFDEEMTLALAIQMLDRYAELHARGIIHNGVKPGNICLAAPKADLSVLHLIDFECSFSYPEINNKIWLRYGPENSRDKRFGSALSVHDFTQSQRDDLESLGYLLSAVYHGSLPWDSNPCNTWRIKMSTPGSTLFRDMDPSFLEYWRDVKALVFAEVPDYNAMKSRFIQCWEKRGYANSPGKYDWFALCGRLQDKRQFPPALDNPVEMSPLSASGPTSNLSQVVH